MTKVHRDLDDILKKKLEAKSFPVGGAPVGAIAARYGVSTDVVRSMCARYGMSIKGPTKDGDRVLFYKPSVFDHPITRQPALAGNLPVEVKDLQNELQKLFMPDYTGWKWAFHRLSWRHPKVYNFLFEKDKINILSRQLKRMRQKSRAKKIPTTQITPVQNPPDRVGSVFSGDDTKALAESMKRHFSSFKWKMGDILIVDNLQMAHAGLPGFGPRLLRVLLSNPVQIDLSATGLGRQAPKDSRDYVSVGEFLRTSAGSSPQGS